MAAPTKNREIQVQKPAQSLQAFQKKVVATDHTHEGLLKQIAIGAACLLGLVVSYFIYAAVRNRGIERHEAAVAAVLRKVNGTDASNAPKPEEQEKLIREQLPQLETLARSAPSSRRAVTEGLVAAWKLQLEGKGSTLPKPETPWDRVRLAQRAIALGQGREALDLLTPLRKKAAPEEPWAGPYWTALLEADALLGQREQAWKDYSDYRARYKDQADTQSMERILNGI